MRGNMSRELKLSKVAVAALLDSVQGQFYGEALRGATTPEALYVVCRALVTAIREGLFEETSATRLEVENVDDLARRLSMEAYSQTDAGRREVA